MPLAAANHAARSARWRHPGGPGRCAGKHTHTRTASSPPPPHTEKTHVCTRVNTPRHILISLHRETARTPPSTIASTLAMATRHRRHRRPPQCTWHHLPVTVTTSVIAAIIPIPTVATTAAASTSTTTTPSPSPPSSLSASLPPPSPPPPPTPGCFSFPPSGFLLHPCLPLTDLFRAEEVVPLCVHHFAGPGLNKGRSCTAPVLRVSRTTGATGDDAKINLLCTCHPLLRKADPGTQGR